MSVNDILPDDQVATAEFARLWPEMVALHPEKVIFTGGEPLLRADILELLGGLRAADPEHHVLALSEHERTSGDAGVGAGADRVGG